MAESTTVEDRPSDGQVRRVLVSADSHGGAPQGEMDQVMARGHDAPASGTDSPLGPRVRMLENAFKKNPEVHPEDRIREADIDGVVAEVIYGATGFSSGDFRGRPRARAAVERLVGRGLRRPPRPVRAVGEPADPHRDVRGRRRGEAH